MSDEKLDPSRPYEPMPPAPPRPTPNPFFTALISIGAIALVLGFIVLSIGVVNSANYRGSLDSGVGEIAFGGPVMELGGLLFVAGLVVGGVDWAIRNRR